jgi:hypothetical protein
MDQNNTLPVQANSYKRFFYRVWIPNLIVTFVFAVILLNCWNQYVAITATRITFLTNLICLVLVWIHTVLLVIFSIRRFLKKQIYAGISLVVHLFISGIIGFYFFTILSLFGWVYAMKGH